MSAIPTRFTPELLARLEAEAPAMLVLLKTIVDALQGEAFEDAIRLGIDREIVQAEELIFRVRGFR